MNTYIKTLCNKAITKLDSASKIRSKNRHHRIWEIAHTGPQNIAQLKMLEHYCNSTDDILRNTSYIYDLVYSPVRWNTKTIKIAKGRRKKRKSLEKTK